MVNTSRDVCFCWKPYIHSNRQVNPGNRQRCGCSVRTLPFDHFVIHSHWINAEQYWGIICSCPRASVKRFSNVRGGEIQSRVQLCPAVLSGPDQLCGHVMPVLGKREERQGNEAVTHRRSSSTSHSGWEQHASEALGGRPKLCWTTESCVSHRDRAGKMAALVQRIRDRGSWNSDKGLLVLNMFGYCIELETKWVLGSAVAKLLSGIVCNTNQICNRRQIPLKKRHPCFSASCFRCTVVWRKNQ